MTPQQCWKAHAWRVAFLLALCVLVYWLGLGSPGFAHSEGHRVVPAWQMLESGDWMVTRLFDVVYLRKPPGMPWAIALSSEIFGTTEFGARAVSALAATLMVLASYAFAARWFGARWALAAGVAQALTPLFWESARTAEIESLHNFLVQISVLMMLDLLAWQRSGRTRHVLWGAAIGTTLAGAMVVKGPAGLVCVGGTIAAVIVVLRSSQALRNIGVWVALLVLAGISAAVLYAVAEASSQAEGYVERQSMDEFLFQWLGAIKMIPSAFLAGVPSTLAVLLVFRRERFGVSTSSAMMARVLGLSCVLSLCGYALLGMENPRYAWPAVTFVAPLVAFALREWNEGYSPRTDHLMRLVMIGHPATWVVILTGVLLGRMIWIDPARAARSGREPGIRLGEALPARAEIWANGLIDARPEVMLYAQQTATTRNAELVVHWAPMWSQTPSLPPVHDVPVYVALREEQGKSERDVFEDAGLMDRLSPVFEDRVHKYPFTVYQVVPSSEPR